MATAALALSPGQVIEEPTIVPAEEQEYVENLNKHIMCPDCREIPPNIFEDWTEGNVTCTACGLVLETHLVDNRSEWRTFANDDGNGDDPSRVGKAADPLDGGNELETSIAYGDGGSRARELTRAQNRTVQDKSLKDVQTMFRQIEQACVTLHVPEVTVQFAKQIYKAAHNDRMFKGKHPDAMRAGCIFIACRMNDTRREFNDLKRVTQVSKKEIGRTFKLLTEYMAKGGLKKVKNMGGAEGPPGADPAAPSAQATTPSELVRRYGSALALSTSAVSICVKIADNLKNVGTLSGRNPSTIAGACIYMGSALVGTPKTAKEIESIVSVKDSTIRGAFKLLAPEKDRLVDKAWIDDGRVSMDRLPPS